jgi:hypothetical protein
VWRVNHYGRLEVDLLVGRETGAETRVVPLMIHRGHMRMLVPERECDAFKLAAEWTLQGKISKELEMSGWREYLDPAKDDCQMTPSKMPKCPRCHEAELDRVGKVLPDVPWSFREHPVSTQELILEAAKIPLCQRPSFAYGIRVKEIFAGAGDWTKAMQEAGIGCDEPIEHSEDPLRQAGPQPCHDLRIPAVRQRLLEEARELPGPEAANVWQWSTPCTSFCDYSLQKAGARTWS